MGLYIVECTFYRYNYNQPYFDFIEICTLITCETTLQLG
jgi:hypothetical protein